MSRATVFAKLLIGILAMNASFCPCPAFAAERGDTGPSAASSSHTMHASGHVAHTPGEAGDSTDQATDDCHAGTARDQCSMANGLDDDARPAKVEQTYDPVAIAVTAFVLLRPAAGMKTGSATRAPSVVRPPATPITTNDRLLI